MLSKKAMDEITEAIWDRLCGDVSIGKGMIKSSVHEALAGWCAVNGQDVPPMVPPMMTATVQASASETCGHEYIHLGTIPAGEELTVEHIDYFKRLAKEKRLDPIPGGFYSVHKPSEIEHREWDQVKRANERQKAWDAHLERMKNLPTVPNAFRAEAERRNAMQPGEYPEYVNTSSSEIVIKGTTIPAGHQVVTCMFTGKRRLVPIN